MKYYKALDMNMKAKHGNKMQYEIGKWYVIEGAVIPCKNGFHFCDSIETINAHYTIRESRIFEIEADGKIVKCDDKYIAERIKLVKEIKKEKINDYFRQNQEKFITSKNSYIRMAVAEQGYGLDALINDEDHWVRAAVAKQGYGLDILIHDEDCLVRQAVAEQGYGLDILINDEDSDVRTAVAEQGYGLDVLINDAYSWVRATVARQGYGLDILINDKNSAVRTIVAEQGYGLHILIRDENDYVRYVAQEMLKQQQ